MALENEKYVLSLCDDVVGIPGRRQHTFNWLLGDASPNTGRRKPLPVDAYWPSLSLVVEFHEKQHTEAVAHFDKPHRLTVSGVHRGIQRRLYDDRRRQLIPKHGLTLIIISMSEFCVRRRRIVPRREEDLDLVKRRLADFVT